MPSAVEALQPLCRFNVVDMIVEVRCDEESRVWYVTIGNLFHSQTLLATSARAAFMALECVSSDNVKLPPGVHLLGKGRG